MKASGNNAVSLGEEGRVDERKRRARVEKDARWRKKNKGPASGGKLI